MNQFEKDDFIFNPMTGDKLNKSHVLKYVNEEISFSTVSQVKLVTNEDLQQVREWKNKVVAMRDRYKGSELYDVFNEEVKRVIEFLNKFM